MNFDIFISHASEDKDDFVRELAEKLQERRISVWYDEHTLRVGDSLRQSIDFGLSKSRFGIVVLSKDFFNKQWTNWELDGLVQRQLNSSNNLIIPIWHKIEKHDILNYSPSLADKVAIKSNIGIGKIIEKIDSVLNPKGSTLIVARDYLIDKGFNPPTLTDDWWLDVLEYPGNTVLENDYSKFNIPWLGFEPSKRGKCIGQNALQMLWRENAQQYDISQLSHPDVILDFIESQPGLKEICIEQPLKTALYFPQLTIKGMGGFVEGIFEELHKQGSRNNRYKCIEEVALRDERFGEYDATTLASFYFTGDGGGMGPSTKLYELIDCLVWLISDKSNWLPDNIHQVLFKGICNWSVWTWSKLDYDGYADYEFTGDFLDYLFDLRENSALKLTDNAKNDLLTRIQVAKDVLDLPETSEELATRFIDKRIVDTWINSKFNRKK